ncbi:hypothetical protein BEI02_16220 [Elizabethkingia sp. HvH-WGS333]|uniref:Uncharacterized protein n=1 Tax=Elizabethkingia anophelis NUHP1 TaxID=1338011 RepID=A0A077ECL6_9FLAO|nr:hypothetical protein BD94_1521 [Elizabethkingia anophelis NUHP1]MDV3473064.1 hypothetical protein [Elizabethkingia anophelis]OIK45879.1 hypothetical protein BEI02_16220 [Elizabethkingia sp. HvH-WGS333]
MEIPVVPEIVENRPARILQQPFVFIIALNIHRIFTILRIKNHSQSINNPFILLGFIPSGNRQK